MPSHAGWAASCLLPNSGTRRPASIPRLVDGAPPGEGPFQGPDGRRTTAAPGHDRNLPNLSPWTLPKTADDVSIYKCRGMAGNGVEWTRRTFNNGEVPLEKVWGHPRDRDPAAAGASRIRCL